MAYDRKIRDRGDILDMAGILDFQEVNIVDLRRICRVGKIWKVTG